MDYKRSEKEKEYLIKAIDSSERQFIIISPDFEVIAANAYTMQLLGTDIIGKHCCEIFYEKSTTCESCPALSVIKTHKPSLRFKKEDVLSDDFRTCRYSYPIMSGENLEAIALFTFNRPTIEEIEEKLKRANAFLRNLILSSVDGVIAADMKGKILIFNDAAVEIGGYTIDEAINTLNIRQIYPGEGAKDIMRHLRSDEYGGKGKLKSFRVDVLRKDGQIIPICLNAAIVYEGDKEVATIGFFHDMRDELKIKSDLEKTHVKLLQAEKMSALGKLAAGVAHQLNNPLGGITLFAKIIMEEYELDPLVKSDLERILNEAKKCSDTVKELLEFARQTSNLIRPHDINSAINRTMFLLENQALFQNIKISKHFDDTIPQVYVDIQQMNHVFMNIILNAGQAMDGKGTLTIRTSMSNDKEKVCIEIEDTGPGISEEIAAHIFDPFFTTKEEGKGTGLGLSIVYSIIEDHKGSIAVKSKPGEGATFIIELPISHQGEKGGQTT
ncbi:MAG: PAS domain-containing protein [Desulfobacterales bacterium]|nr:PAS domain-containing protein [Desulfobacterales bacterium]